MWFDVDCIKARRVSLTWLGIFRKHRTNTSKEYYVEANKKYRTLCALKKRKYYNGIGEKLKEIKDRKEWWDWVKRLKNVNFVIGTAVTCEDLQVYFNNLLNPQIRQSHFSFAEPYREVEELDSDFCVEEVKNVLTGLKKNKAPGEDRVPIEFFKNAPDNCLEILTKLFNNILNGSDLGGSFHKNLIFPIHKKGDRNSAENYRGISFCNSVCKILAGLLNNRLIKFVSKNKLLNECQAGFRAGYSTMDNIFNLDCLVKLKWNEGKKKVYCFFVDLKAAFDRINRKALFYKLFNMGLSNKFVTLLKKLYEKTYNAVWDGESLSNWFETTMGVKQGCILSPLLFALFLDDLDDFIGGGLRVGEVVIRILLYADDLVLFADEPDTLQNMINRLEKYCRMWSLVINMSKSNIMVMKQGGGRRGMKEKWTMDGEQIEVVTKYKYLGIELTPSLNLSEHFKSRVKQSKSNLNMIWSQFVGKKEVSFQDKYEVFKSVSRSIVCYACQVWGCNESEEIEKFRRWFIKRVLFLPQYTPNYIINIETKTAPVLEFTLRCHFNYIMNVLYKYDENRLPRILGSKIINEKISWFTEWETLGQKYGLEWGNWIDNEREWKNNCQKILNFERDWGVQQSILNGRQTTNHGLYNKLNYVSGVEYLESNLSTYNLGKILKARGGLWQLNGNSFNLDQTKECSLCNLGEEETFSHTFGACPVFKEYRKLYFGTLFLPEDRTVAILNGEDWGLLVKYIKTVQNYRSMLIREFNW